MKSARLRRRSKSLTRKAGVRVTPEGGQAHVSGGRAAVSLGVVVVHGALGEGHWDIYPKAHGTGRRWI